MSDKRVFILGAGASHEVSKRFSRPIPLANQFFTSEYINNYWPNQYLDRYKFSKSSLYKFINNYFKGLPDHFVGEKVNVEDVYSFLDYIILNSIQLENNKNTLQQAKHELLEYIRSLIYNIVIEETERPIDNDLYGNIVTSLVKGDTVISFNWDTLFEDALSNNLDMGERYLNNLRGILNPQIEQYDQYFDIQMKEIQQGYYLKLHGSIDWAICKSTTCKRHNIPFVIREADFATDFTCNFCGSELEIMIMPPHIHKSFQKHRVFTLQARIAYDKLSSAEEIIVIGYSFPDFDFEVKSLIRMSRPPFDLELDPLGDDLKKVIIVNPMISDSSYIHKIKDLFGLNNKESHNNQVKLELYKSVDEYTKKYFPPLLASPRV